MMVWSINLLALSIGILIAGMIKPKWILFWLANPSRIQIQFLAVALFMAATVMFGDANLEKQQEVAAAETEKSIDVEEAPTIAVELKKEQI